jgi:glycine/D-amino acid oxidase-like deaminating enzyme
MDYNEWGGFEILGTENHHAIDRLEEVNQALDPLFGQRIFSEELELVSSFGFNPSEAKTVIKNPLEGQLNPYKMIQHLTAKVLELGVSIWYNAKVDSIEQESPFLLSVPEHPISEIRAEKVVVCTNAFSKTLLPDISLNPGRGQVLITRPIDSLKLKGTFHSDEGYIYFRNVGNRLLIGGARNADFEGETTTEFGTSKVIQDRLKHWIENVILPKTSYEIEHSWSGIMAFGPERRPVISEPQPGLFVGIRLGGMGVALGSWLGEELAKKHDAE